MAETPAETPPAPRKRGRPRKDATQTASKPAKKPAKRGKTTAKTATKTPKKRGRPPKNPDKLRPEYVDGYTFDPARAARVVDFIEKFCVQSKGKWAGKPYQLMDWQKKDVIEPLFGWVDAQENRRYRSASIFTPKKCGKDLALDTPVLTTAGWKTIGTVSVGDFVFHPSGRPVPVVAKSEVFENNPCFEMGFSHTDETIVAGGGHLWKTFCRICEPGAKTGSKHNRKSGWGIRTTEEISRTLKYAQGNNHTLPVAEPLQYPEKDLPANPWLLGAWLGDGDSSAARLTVGDLDLDEMLKKVQAVASEATAGKYPSSTAHHISIRSGFVKTLRTLGILKNKRIPEQYFSGSERQRRELLCGLMDTDGFAAKNGQCELTLKAGPLATDCVRLIETMGVKVTSKTEPATCNGKPAGFRERIRFQENIETSCFTLERKRKRLKPRPNPGKNTRNREKMHRSKTRKITKCDPVETVKTQCIQVGADDGMFLAGRSLIPTHNSTLAAAFCLYFLIADREPGAEVVIAASDRNQAGIIARELFSIVKASPFLSSRLEAIESRNTIVDRETNSRAYVITSEGHRAEGINAHAVIVDELHAQKDRRLFDALKWAGSARDQPMFLTISTAGYDKSPGAIWWEQWQYAERVAADPSIDPAFFGKIYAAPPVDDVAEYFTNRQHWYDANPSLGVTMSEQSFAADAREAENTPSKLNAWLRYRLNVPTQADTRWIAPATWALGNRQWSAPLAGRQCWAGLDLASTRDLTAFVAIFENDDDGFDVDAHFWIPADRVAERSRVDNVPYADFVREGWLKTTPGNIADYDAIRAWIVDYSNRHHIHTLAADRWNANAMLVQLSGEGLNILGFGQGFSAMCEPCRKTEVLIESGRLAHRGNPVLEWMANNVAIAEDANGNIRCSRERSTEKIDGIISLVMAVGVHSTAVRKADTDWNIYVLD